MLVWIIVIVLLLLFLILPVGADAAYSGAVFTLKLKIGHLKLKLLPGTSGEKPAEKPTKPKKPKKESKLKLNRDDIFTLLHIAFRALDRFRKHLSIDLLKLHWTAAAEDPCDAVMQYGEINAALCVLQQPAHSVLRIGEEDLRTDVRFDIAKPEIDARAVITLQIWEILFIAICAGAPALHWYWKKAVKPANRNSSRRRKERNDG